MDVTAGGTTAEGCQRVPWSGSLSGVVRLIGRRGSLPLLTLLQRVRRPRCARRKGFTFLLPNARAGNTSLSVLVRGFAGLRQPTRRGNAIESSAPTSQRSRPHNLAISQRQVRELGGEVKSRCWISCSRIALVTLSISATAPDLAQGQRRSSEFWSGVQRLSMECTTSITSPGPRGTLETQTVAIDRAASYPFPPIVPDTLRPLALCDLFLTEIRKRSDNNARLVVRRPLLSLAPFDVHLTVTTHIQPRAPQPATGPSISSIAVLHREVHRDTIGFPARPTFPDLLAIELASAASEPPGQRAVKWGLRAIPAPVGGAAILDDASDRGSSPHIDTAGKHDPSRVSDRFLQGFSRVRIICIGSPDSVAVAGERPSSPAYLTAQSTLCSGLLKSIIDLPDARHLSISGVTAALDAISLQDGELGLLLMTGQTDQSCERVGGICFAIEMHRSDKRPTSLDHHLLSGPALIALQSLGTVERAVEQLRPYLDRVNRILALSR